MGSGPGKALIKVLLISALAFLACKPPNHAPDAPTPPIGPKTGYVGCAYSFCTAASDPEEDSVSICFDWGDGTVSSWTPFAACGETIKASHRWDAGVYVLRARARNARGAQSGWSPNRVLRVEWSDRLPTAFLYDLYLPDEGPDDGTCSPDGKTAYFSFGEFVTAIDTQGDTLLWTTEELYGDVLQLTEDGSLLYVVSRDSAFVYDVQTGTVVSRLPLNWRHDDFVLAPDGSRGYAVSGDSLLAVRTSDMAIVKTVLRGDWPHSVTRSLDGKYLYVGTYTGIVSVRTDTDSVVGRFDFPEGCDAFAVLPSNEYLYACWGEDSILKIRTSDMTAVDTLCAVPFLVALAASPDNRYVFGMGMDDICIISTTTNELLAVFDFDGCGCALPVVLPDLSKLYAACHFTVSVYGSSSEVANQPLPLLASSPWPKFHHDNQNTGRAGQ